MMVDMGGKCTGCWDDFLLLGRVRRMSRVSKEDVAYLADVIQCEGR